VTRDLYTGSTGVRSGNLYEKRSVVGTGGKYGSEVRLER
jgi:hypothetical protein